MLPVLAPQTQSMTTRDGIRLDADVYYPDAVGPFPVLLMRQPYGRAIASTVVYAHPSWYAAQGYIVVIQDVRGRGTSAGEFHLFAHEREDGYDTVEWAAQLPGSTGAVGMYGFSYQGMTQLYAAAANPPALKTICPSMVAYDLYADWAYEGGAFCYQLNLGWALQLAAETARRRGDDEAYQALYTAAHALPLTDPVCPRSDLLERLTPDSFYHDWLNNPDPQADYWVERSPHTSLDDVALPMLHIGGWFDTHLRGTLKLYRAMAERNRAPHYLWVGPWAHLPWGRRIGVMDYGPEANSPIDRVQIRWFDHFLKGKSTGLLDELPVSLFEMGRNRWRHFATFPAQLQRAYYLGSTGLAALSDQAGTLYAAHLLDPAQPDAEPITLADAVDTWVHDPWRPVPAMGGHATFPPGACDRSLLDSRTDVVTYTTPPLADNLHLAGDLSVELYCTANAPSFDLCAVLSEVRANGSVIYISQGYQRVTRPRASDAAEDNNAWAVPVRCTLTLQPTCLRIAAGSALRLSLSGACAPAYAVNSGTGASPADSRLIEARVIALSIYSGPTYPSRLTVTLAPA